MHIPRGRVAVVTLLVMASTHRLQSQSPAVLTLPDGRVIEVLGLRRWSLAMLQDSLSRYSPGDSLQTHSCAAVLRYTLRFADAAATTYIFRPDRPERVVVSVREPQDSARVHYRDLPRDTANARLEWQPITTVMTTRPAAFWPAVGAFTSGGRGQPARYRTPADSAAAARMLTFLRARTSAPDRLLAQDALAGSPNVLDRAAAALILANFADRDDTWWALVEAMRESDGMAKGVAATVLQALAPRHVDWSPVTVGIHAMLDGTSLFELPTLVSVLSTTGVGPAQAAPFLRGGGDMLLAYLGSGTEMLSSSAHTLLVQLRGADLGGAPEPWRVWIAGL